MFPGIRTWRDELMTTRRREEIRLSFLVVSLLPTNANLQQISLTNFDNFPSTSRAGVVSRSPTDESGWQSRDETYVFASLVPNFSIFFSPSSVALCAIAFIRIDVTFWFDYRYTGTVWDHSVIRRADRCSDRVTFRYHSYSSSYEDKKREEGSEAERSTVKEECRS